MIARRDRFTPTGGQQATRDALRDALRAPAVAPALLLVTGEPGSGKSAMLADLLAGIEDDPDLAVGAISAAAHPDGRFLRTMIAAFDEAPVGRSGIELLTTLRAIFAARAAAGRRPVLLIDGAEALTGSQLEIVRSLLNPVGDGPATLPPMIALIGRPELRERIRRRRPLARRRAHDLQLTVPDRDDIARVTGGTIQQADVLITKANQRGIAPLTLAALVIERTGGAPADDASVRSVLHALPAGEPAELSVEDVVQTTMPFASANGRGANGVSQLTLLQHAGDYAGIDTGGGDQ